VDAEIIGIKECVGYVRIPGTAIFRVNSSRHGDERMQLINFIHMCTGITVSSVAFGGRDFHSWRYLLLSPIQGMDKRLPYCVQGESIPLEYKLLGCTLNSVVSLMIQSKHLDFLP